MNLTTMDPVYFFIITLARAAAKAFFDVKVLNHDKLIQDGPCIYVANHQSFLDPPMIGQLFRDDINFLARKTLMDHPVMNFALSHLNVIPIDQERPDPGSILKVNAYFTGSGATSIVYFRTRLFGLFKINVYLNDSDTPYDAKDVYIRYINSNSKGRILRYNNEYYFYVDVPTNLYDEDGDLISKPEDYRMSVQIAHQKYKKYRIEFVQEQMDFSDDVISASSVMDT
ncbi:MAG: 1-acyl-sn-glycerol-3-phosphate acyltransferase, partial [Akkermansia sp.]|nr:1-acyl-sn-glycerol-3-phosphate acyltransferase [Akkermansia sp.]